MTAPDNFLLLRAFCDELARCGMRHAATAPGSRKVKRLLALSVQKKGRLTRSPCRMSRKYRDS